MDRRPAAATCEAPSPAAAATRALMILVAALALSGCWTDAATRLAQDLKSGAARLGPNEGAKASLVHRVPSRAGECTGPYRVQLDRVGAIIVWCKDATGAVTVSSHSTTSHGRIVDTPETYIVDKAAGEPLMIGLERLGGRVLISSAR